MTSRLLRASLGSPGYDGIRDALRRDTSAPLLTVPGTEVRASVLPLFRRDAAGTLRQCVLVEAATAQAHGARRGDFHLTITFAGAVADQARLAPDGRAMLFVPEVDAPATAVLELRDEAAAVNPLASAPLEITPQRKWTVFVVHHSHLDIGYTDPQGVVLRHHHDYLDSALSIAEATDGWPDDARFRWSVESTMPALRWLSDSPRAAVRAFTDRVREGRIEVTAFPFQLHTEACSEEELSRQLRFIKQLRDRYGITVRSAMHTDVPGAVAGLVDALAGEGVRYLSAAHNWAGRSVPYLTGGDQLSRPFRWRAPSGNELTVWFTDTPHGMAYMEGNTVGFADGYDLTVDLLPRYLDALARRPYPYGEEAFGWTGMSQEAAAGKAPYAFDAVHLRLQGAHADNAGPSIIPAQVVRQWNETWAYPRLRMATNSEFFDHIEQHHGDALEVHEGDWTDWWADGMGSGARPLGYTRRAQSLLRSAGTLHALAGARADEGDQPAVVSESDEIDEIDESAFDAAWDTIALFNEHTWGAANPWEDGEDGFHSGGVQWTLKSSLGYRAYDAAADLQQSGERRLGATFGRNPGTVASFVVVNPGPGGRTDIVETFLPRDVADIDVPIRLIDARTGTAVPHHEELVHPEDFPARPIGRKLSFVLSGLPSFGYARVDVHRDSEAAVRPANRESGESGEASAAGVIENEFYRVGYDLQGGGIASIFDKRAGRELVNADGLALFGQYVYDSYATAPFFNHLSGHVAATDTTLLGARAVAENAIIEKAERTPAGERVTVRQTAKGAEWLRTTVALYPGVPRVDLTFRLAKEATAAKEAVFFAFPFAVAGPPAAWELTGGVGGTAVPRVPGSATHMLPVRHWIAFEDPELSVAWATLEAPLVQLGNIHIPYAPFPPTLPHEPGTVYSWALNNIWDTNFPTGQGGEMTFKYAVSSGTQDARRLGVATAAGLTDPLIAVLATGNAPAPASGTFLAVGHPDVRVTSVGGFGGALTARLRSVAAEPVTTQVSVLGADPVTVTIPACGGTEVTTARS
jgi:hypothetical protein